MARRTRSSKHTRAIPRATFDRLIKEIAQEMDLNVMWSGDAIDALHEESETYLSERFQNAHYLCDTFKERTLSMKHFTSAKTLASPA